MPDVEAAGIIQQIQKTVSELQKPKDREAVIFPATHKALLLEADRVLDDVLDESA